MTLNPRAPRPNAFVHSLNELSGRREDAREHLGTFDIATRAIYDASEQTWLRLAIVLERKEAERGKETWSMSSIESIGLLEELRDAYRTIDRAAKREP